MTGKYGYVFIALVLALLIANSILWIWIGYVHEKELHKWLNDGYDSAEKYYLPLLNHCQGLASDCFLERHQLKEELQHCVNTGGELLKKDELCRGHGIVITGDSEKWNDCNISRTNTTDHSITLYYLNESLSFITHLEGFHEK